MSDLAATHCGSGCEGGFFGGNNCIWLIIILFCCGNGCGSDGCGSNGGCCDIILPLLLISCFCGGGNGFGGGCC